MKHSISIPLLTLALSQPVLAKEDMREMFNELKAQVTTLQGQVNQSNTRINELEKELAQAHASQQIAPAKTTAITPTAPVVATNSNTVLDISKMETGHMALDIQAFDLLKWLDDIGEMTKIRAENKHLGFSLDINPNVPPYIKTDYDNLQKIVLNLLENALKFTAQGQIGLRAKTLPLPDMTKVMLEIEVIDSGIGIAADKLPDLFKPFVQFARTDSGLEGTGLGLVVSKSLIELMGGKISVDSVFGEGSTFKIQLPITIAHADEVVMETKQRMEKEISSKQPLNLELMGEGLAVLPEELKQQLHQAALSLDVEETEAVITRIRQIAPDIAVELQKLAQNYQFEQIIQLTKGAKIPC